MQQSNDLPRAARSGEARVFLFRNWAPQPHEPAAALKALARCQWAQYDLMVTVRRLLGRLKPCMLL